MIEFELLVAVRWFSPGTPVSSTNKTDSHIITKILLKVALNTVTLTLTIHVHVRMSFLLHSRNIDEKITFFLCYEFIQSVRL